MRRAIFIALAAIILAGIIHISTVFLVPLYASKDAWAQMRQFGRNGQFHSLPVPEAGAEPLAALDPRMIYSVCRFSLAQGPVRITASLPDDFWSIAIFDRRGRNVYSLNDRSAERSKLDMAIVTPVQMAQLRQDPPASLETAIVVELPIENGFALVRVFVADESLLTSSISALATADCAGSL
jgi:uncharacterized membrane protein